MATHTLAVSLVLVFLNAHRNNPQARGYTIVAFHLEVFRVSLIYIFSTEGMV